MFEAIHIDSSLRILFEIERQSPLKASRNAPRGREEESTFREDDPRPSTPYETSPDVSPPKQSRKTEPLPTPHPTERNRSGSRPERTSRNKNRIPSEELSFVSVPGTMTSLTFEKQKHRPKSLCKQQARSSQREQKGPIVLRSLITISFPRFASLQTPTWDKAHFSSDVSIPTRFMALNGGGFFLIESLSNEKRFGSLFFKLGLLRTDYMNKDLVGTQKKY
ncbi:hypothetical protein CEXT_347971 [Caerostris extrusa]|uniref:Uncharacterized protein n=1 Tax=Caerostris extrusa TaxID=172846 RepID=A0AAV4RZJ0_CAEEX|nr:hypothetical protein CEXT_347971 [Caerostris extrusa]